MPPLALLQACCATLSPHRFHLRELSDPGHHLETGAFVNEQIAEDRGVRPVLPLQRMHERHTLLIAHAAQKLSECRRLRHWRRIPRP